MATVAEQLRRAREAQHLDIPQMAEITKIKTDHLRALESGNYDSFLAQVYVRGFVRTYARALKLDMARLNADLESELRQIPRFREPPPLTTEPRTVLDLIMLQVSKLNWRIVVAATALALVIILAVGGFRKWNRREQVDPARSLGPGLYRSGQSTGEVLSLPQ